MVIYLGESIYKYNPSCLISVTYVFITKHTPLSIQYKEIICSSFYERISKLKYVGQCFNLLIINSQIYFYDSSLLLNISAKLACGKKCLV